MAVLKRAPGDIIPIPAKKDGELGFVLSRVIYSDVVTCIEVFCDFHTNFFITEEELKNEKISIKNRLIKPIYAAFDFTKFSGKTKWPILLHNENYDAERDSELSKIEFATELYERHGIYMRARSNECQEINGIRRDLENRQVYSNPQLVHRVNLHLSGYLKRFETWGPLRVRQAMDDKGGIEWLTGQTYESIEIAEAVAEKFKAARKRKM